MKIKNKKYLVLSIVLMLALSCFLSFQNAYSFESDGVDIVLVLDCSSSLKTSDPDKLILKSAIMVAEMIKAKGWRYGVIMFEGNVTGTIPLREIENQHSVDTITEELQSLYHQNGKWTDLPRGLYQAILMLLKEDGFNKQRVIIALTDGEDDPELGRSIENVNTDRENAIAIAKDADIPIFTIGLNVSGSFSQDNNKLISNETKAQAYEVRESSQVEPTVTDIIERFYSQINSEEPSPLPSDDPSLPPMQSIITPQPTESTQQPTEQTPPTTDERNYIFVAIVIGIVCIFAIFMIVFMFSNSKKEYVLSIKLEYSKNIRVFDVKKRIPLPKKRFSCLSFRGMFLEYELMNKDSPFFKPIRHILLFKIADRMILFKLGDVHRKILLSSFRNKAILSLSSSEKETITINASVDLKLCILLQVKIK